MNIAHQASLPAHRAHAVCQSCVNSDAGYTDYSEAETIDEGRERWEEEEELYRTSTRPPP